MSDNKRSYIQLQRSSDVENVIKDHSAFALLTFIARRARRTDSDKFYDENLAIGEALIGDWKAMGFSSEMKYRCAKERLAKWKLITTRTTNKGTIAKLLSIDVYDINEVKNSEPNNKQIASKERTNSEPIATNKNDNNENNAKNDNNILRPQSVSELVWNDFLSHRKLKKAKLTQTALNTIEKEATKAGWTLEQALTESITRGWTGFKADWVSNNSNKPIPFTQPTKTSGRNTGTYNENGLNDYSIFDKKGKI